MKRSKKKILLIDDDVNFLTINKKILVYAGYEIDICSKPMELFKNYNLSNFDLIISDLVMPDIDGIEVLKFILEKYPYSKVIILTGNGTIDTAVEAIKLGAYTYIEKPILPDKLVQKINDIINVVEKSNKDFIEGELQDIIIGKSKEMVAIRDNIDKISKVDSSVLISGNSGTGKELIANLIHRTSLRNKGPFIKLNCAAIPDTLFESEFFGFEKGSFTGAIKDKKGKMELANNGTLFLDEVNELSTMAQSKILRAIQEREIDRIGGNSPLKVDFRLICATNKNLKDLVKEGKFREDLYYRINIVNINIAPLKNRKADIPVFIDYFSKLYSNAFKKKINPMSTEILNIFLKYDWQGNVSELKNGIERIYNYYEENSEIIKDK